jgi:hypothetical protein
MQIKWSSLSLTGNACAQFVSPRKASKSMTTPVMSTNHCHVLSVHYICALPSTHPSDSQWKVILVGELHAVRTHEALERFAAHLAQRFLVEAAGLVLWTDGDDHGR